jgi:hypothetical protein
MRKSIKAAKAAVSSNVPAIIDPANVAADETAKLETVSVTEIAGGVTIDNATGETIADTSTDNTATEATPDERVLKAARIAADRATVRKLYSAFEANRLSVPVKALSSFKLATSTAHPITRNPSTRQAAAICVALAAAGVKLADGARAPRVFEFDGVNSAIENGVMRDAISSGLITVSGASPEAETIRVAKHGAAKLSALLGATLLKQAGLLA